MKYGECIVYFLWIAGLDKVSLMLVMPNARDIVGLTANTIPRASVVTRLPDAFYCANLVYFGIC